MIFNVNMKMNVLPILRGLGEGTQALSDNATLVSGLPTYAVVEG
jgi:hypothetical protein